MSARTRLAARATLSQVDGVRSCLLSSMIPALARP
jgi:hypothetical protein